MGSPWWLGAVFLAVGCEGAPEPRVIAAKEQAQCRYLAPTADRIAVDRRLVDGVEPNTAHVYSLQMQNPEARVIGAKLHIRPIEGVTPSTLGTVLVCHETQQLLRGPTLADDPYSLPDYWVDIHVEPEGPGYVVTTEGPNVTVGLELLARARAFAHQGPTPAIPPEVEP
jgi:hypothetical protein